MNRKFFFSLIIVAAVIASCSSDSEDPMATCEPDNLTYTNDIAAIINTNCATTDVCHTATSTRIFSLADFNAVNLQIPENRISGAINQLSGFAAMPRNAERLDDCTIAMIDQWLDDGAPE